MYEMVDWLKLAVDVQEEMRQQLNQELILLQQKYVGINIQLIKKS
jgi:hypothetical protein